jgi:hypothetical protein
MITIHVHNWIIDLDHPIVAVQQLFKCHKIENKTVNYTEIPLNDDSVRHILISSFLSLCMARETCVCMDLRLVYFYIM